MLYDVVERPGSYTPTELCEAYMSEVRQVVESNGVKTVADRSGVDEEKIDAIAAGRTPDLSLEEATAILAAAEGNPDAESIVMEFRDDLLMGMTTGVLDVDTVAANVDLDLSGQEVQQVLEGRNPVTLLQLATLHQYIAERNEE